MTRLSKWRLIYYLLRFQIGTFVLYLALTIATEPNRFWTYVLSSKQLRCLLETGESQLAFALLCSALLAYAACPSTVNHLCRRAAHNSLNDKGIVASAGTNTTPTDSPSATSAAIHCSNIDNR